MSKKYILQKHLPGVNSGSIITPMSGLAYGYRDVRGLIHLEWANEYVENNPDWFLPIEEKSPKELVWDKIEDMYTLDKINFRTRRHLFEAVWIEVEKHWEEIFRKVNKL